MLRNFSHLQLLKRYSESNLNVTFQWWKCVRIMQFINWNCVLWSRTSLLYTCQNVPCYHNFLLSLDQCNSASSAKYGSQSKFSDAELHAWKPWSSAAFTVDNSYLVHLPFCRNMDIVKVFCYFVVWHFCWYPYVHHKRFQPQNHPILSSVSGQNIVL